MKGGSVCSNSTIQTIGDESDSTKFQAYTYSATSVSGMDCGFFIEVSTLPGSKTVPEPSDGKPRNDIFVNITGSGIEAKATEFNVQDMMFAGSAASEVSNYRDANDKKIDSVLQGKIDEGGPIEAIDAVLGKENYKIIIFDVSGNKEYVKRGQSFDENNFLLPGLSSPTQAPKAPTTEKEDAALPTVEPENSEHQFYELSALVGTDKEGSIDVLKFHGPVKMNAAPQQNTSQINLDDGEILNKDSLARVLCRPILEKLGTNEKTKEMFNLSSSLLQAAQNDFKTKTEREQASADNLNKAKGELLAAISKLKKLNIAGIDNLEDVNKSIDRYIELEKFIEQDTIPQTFNGHILSKAILSKYESPDGLDRQKLYNLCKAITSNINGLLGYLSSISSIIEEDGDVEIIENIISKDGHKRNVNTQKRTEKQQFMNNVSKYLFSAKKIPLLTGDVTYTSSFNSAKQTARSTMSGLRRGVDTSVQGIGEGVGKAKNSFSKRVGKASNSIGSFFKGLSKKNQTEGPEGPEEPTVGGKRKTRKNKARKTRRKVQRKRRQSKKH